MTWVIALCLIALAAAANAASDTLVFHRPVSIWRNAGWFWTVDQHRVMIFRYPVNAWHLLKSFWLSCFFTVPYLYLRSGVVLHPLADIAIAGTLYIQVFNLFFNHILKRNVTP